MKGFCSLIYLGCLGLCLGTGVVLGSDSSQAEAAKTDVQMVYEGYPLKITCNLTLTADNVNDGKGDDADDDNNNPVAPMLLDWFKDGEQLTDGDHVKIFQNNYTMLVSSPTREDTGDYKCQTQTGDVSKTITVIFLEIKKMFKSQSVVEKEVLEIECMADGEPRPLIHWLKDQQSLAEMMSNDSRISFKPNNKEMPNGTLVITDVQWGDRGNYTCVVTSVLQSYEKWTFVRVKDFYAALWPFIGIVIEVVVLGIIIIIFEKRRAKAEFDESDTDQGNDQ